MVRQVMYSRNTTRRIELGSVVIGGGAPVSVQSMCNTNTADVVKTLSQIRELEAAGCEIIRVTVPDLEAAAALPKIIAGAKIPVVGDIHFDYRLALAAIDAGCAGIRLNPGNIGSEERVRQVAEAALKRQTVIRVGSNAGSLSQVYRQKVLEAGRERHDEVLAEVLALSALEQCQILEKYHFNRIKVSLKASSVPVTVLAARRFAQISDYPQHLGITEAGTPTGGIIKSACGLGSLLLDGIGDTIRVSLTADPVREIDTAIRILESCQLRTPAPDLIACPTCGRTSFNLIELAERTEAYIKTLKAEGKQLKLRKIAVMGCAVNGPGEAKDADLGLAGSTNGNVVLFHFGEVSGVYPVEEGFRRFCAEIAAQSSEQ